MTDVPHYASVRFDSVGSITVADDGSMYLAGITKSSDFPLVNPYQSTHSIDYDAFCARMSADGSSLIFSTLFGGNGEDGISGILVGSDGSVYIAGTTESTDFPTVNALQDTLRGDSFDAYVSKLSPAGNELVFSTYLGGSGGDYVRDMRRR